MKLFSLLPTPIANRLSRTPVTRRLARGAFWTLAGTVSMRALSIPVSVLLARYMGPSHYGELGIINSSVDLFMVFAGFGLGLTANKHTAEYRTKDPDRAGRILGLSTLTAFGTGLLFATVLFIAAPWLAEHTLAAPQLTTSLRISSLLLFFSAINGAQSGALYGFEAFKIVAQIQAVVGVVNVPFIVVGYFVGGLNGVLWGMVGTRILDYAVNAYVLRAEARRAGIHICYSQCTHELPILWRFSLPALLAGSMVGPVNWLCNTMLVRQPNGYREMGMYNAAAAWYGALLFLPIALGSALLPLLSERMGHRDHKSSSTVLWTMLRLNAAIVIPGAIVLSIGSSHIMRMYGPEYSHAAPILVVVVFTAAIYAILMPVGDVISASGRMWTGFAMNAGWAAIVVSSTWVLVSWGAFGLAVARLVAYIVHATWTSAYAARILCAKNRSESSERSGAEPAAWCASGVVEK